MQKTATFLYSLKQTFTSLSYYADVLRAPFSFSLKFFYMFFFVYSLVFTTFITIKYFLPLNDLISFLPKKLVEVYPRELEITIKDGHVSTNVSEPYRIPLEDIENMLNELHKRVLGQSTETIEYLLVIDTKSKIEDFLKYQTYILLTKNHLSYINPNGNIETISLAKIDDFTINQGVVRNVVNLITPFLKFVVPMLVVATFFFFLIFYPLTKLFYLLFYALVLLVIGKIVRFPLPYKKSFQLGLHLIVVSTALFSIADFVGFSPHFPFLQTIFLSVLGIIVLGRIKTLEPSPTPTVDAKSAPV